MCHRADTGGGWTIKGAASTAGVTTTASSATSEGGSVKGWRCHYCRRKAKPLRQLSSSHGEEGAWVESDDQHWWQTKQLDVVNDGVSDDEEGNLALAAAGNGTTVVWRQAGTLRQPSECGLVGSVEL